ncbi:MAG: FeoB-associated Cys-rich membrane protein [Lachnospiraceae bacterium]
MLTWLIQNLGTILVTLALIFIVTRIILHLRKEKKQGCSSCGGNCSHCSACKMSQGDRLSGTFSEKS